jgi:MSHA biogenesis protein MshM
MFRHHFGLKNEPLGKGTTELWDDGHLTLLKERFQWLLDSPGLGLLTGEPGVGKTAALRHVTATLNPHRYQIIYLAETDFGRIDIYRSLALALGLEPAYRRSQVWRDLKARITDLDGKNLLPVWIIDEAQNLPLEFFRDLPAFMNFAFDSRDLMAIWLVGHPYLASTLSRAPYTALTSRIQQKVHLEPVTQRERFPLLIQHALKSAGCQQTIISDPGLEMLRQASQGIPRKAGLILKNALRLAVAKGLSHLPDDLIHEAIGVLQ